MGLEPHDLGVASTKTADRSTTTTDRAAIATRTADRYRHDPPERTLVDNHSLALDARLEMSQLKCPFPQEMSHTRSQAAWQNATISVCRLLSSQQPLCRRQDHPVSRTLVDQANRPNDCSPLDLSFPSPTGRGKKCSEVLASRLDEGLSGDS